MKDEAIAEPEVFQIIFAEPVRGNFILMIILMQKELSVLLVDVIASLPSLMPFDLEALAVRDRLVQDCVAHKLSPDLAEPCHVEVPALPIRAVNCIILELLQIGHDRVTLLAVMRVLWVQQTHRLVWDRIRGAHWA